MQNIPQTTPISSRPAPSGLSLPAGNGTLPPGTRVVLEIPKPGGGYECITPTAQEFAAHVAALIAPAAPGLAVSDPPLSAEDRGDTPPLCPDCGRPKTRKPGGRNLMCRPCFQHKMEDSWARRRAA